MVFFWTYIVVLVLAAILTFLVWHSGNKLQDAIRTDAEVKIATSNAVAENARRDAALANESTAKLSLRIEEEARKRAEAENALLQLQQRLQPRRLPRETFLNALRDKPKGSVVILYQNEDPEAWWFAIDIAAQLNAAGWTAKNPEPLRPSANRPDMPSVFSMGSSFSVGGVYGGRGVSFAAREVDSPPFTRSTPFSALATALDVSGFGLSTFRDESLPENSFRIIVGPRP